MKILLKIGVKLSVIAIVLSCSVNDSIISSSDPLTVQGELRENEFAEILLTNSLAFEGVIDSVKVAKSIESKAKVTLSDGEISEVLTLKRDDSRFPFLFYRSNLIKGNLNKTYDLLITIREKEFLSTTQIPEKPVIKKMDFLEAKKDGVLTPEVKDIRLEIENNLDRINYYKLLIKNENEEKFEPASPFIFNTENIKTTTFPLIINYNTFENGTRESLLRIGQVFELQLIAITKDQFDFWKSITGDETDIIENSAFSNDVITNISGGAFGYWSGENMNFMKFRIPE